MNEGLCGEVRFHNESSNLEKSVVFQGGVDDWERGVPDEENCVLRSIPAVLCTC